MSDSPVRIGFVSADHLHFPGLLRQAIEAPNIEVVGMVIDDAERWELYVVLGVVAFVIVKHLPNIRRLRSKTEPSL